MGSAALPISFTEVAGSEIFIATEECMGYLILIVFWQSEVYSLFMVKENWIPINSHQLRLKLKQNLISA